MSDLDRRLGWLRLSRTLASQGAAPTPGRRTKVQDEARAPGEPAARSGAPGTPAPAGLGPTPAATEAAEEAFGTAYARNSQGDDGDWWSPWGPSPGDGTTDGPGEIEGPAPPPQGKPKAKDPYQARSYYQPEPEDDGPSAGIYFPLEVDSLDVQDDKALEELLDAHADEIQAGKLGVVIRGYADPRRGIYDQQYNTDLARRRAEHTADRLRHKLKARGYGVVPELKIEVFGEDYANPNDRDGLAQGRRADIFLHPDKPLLDTPERGEPVPGIEPTTRFRAKYEDKMSFGIGKDGDGPGGMGGYVRIEREDTPGNGVRYALVLAGKTSWSAPEDSDWVPFVTKHPCHESDFEGLTNAGNVSVLGQSGFGLDLHYPVRENGDLTYDDVWVIFPGDSTDFTPSAELLIGTLEYLEQY